MNYAIRRQAYQYWWAGRRAGGDDSVKRVGFLSCKGQKSYAAIEGSDGCEQH